VTEQQKHKNEQFFAHRIMN